MRASSVVGLLGAATSVAPARRGLVARFDDDAGLGVVDVEGVGELPFHCTAIADGTRTIAPGSPVVCQLGPAHHGAVEAVTVVALGSG